MPIEKFMNAKRITPLELVTPIIGENKKVSTEKNELKFKSSTKCLKINDKKVLISIVGITLIATISLVLVLALLYGLPSLFLFFN